MSLERFNKKSNKNLEINDLDGTFIIIDNKKYKRPITVALSKLKDFFNINLSENYKFKKQQTMPKLPPNAIDLEMPLKTALDGNYLYIWIDDKQIWKRILLSDWDSTLE